MTWHGVVAGGSWRSLQSHGGDARRLPQSLQHGYHHHTGRQLQSDAGPATVVRTRGTRSIDIGGTNANLQSHGVMLSLRYRF